MIEPVAATDFTTHSARRHPSQFESVKFRIDKDVARMTLYRHFSSKDELVAACLRELVADIDADELVMARQERAHLGQLHEAR